MSSPETFPTIWMGLGNPGTRFRGTRHNVGYRAIDLMMKRFGEAFLDRTREAKTWMGSIGNHRILLVKPVTFMNLSGKAAKRILDKKGASPESLIVFHDDMDLEFGRTKLKWKGGDAGHRGIRSIITYLQTDTFFRVRIGIGRPPEGVEATEYVLSNFTPDEEKKLTQTLTRIAEGMVKWADSGIENARNILTLRD